jgi:hypothetical protein
MKCKLAALLTVLSFAPVKVQGAVAVVGEFISTPEYFNGFEAIGTSQYEFNSYTEGGITVSYVGTFRPDARFVDPPLDSSGIWTTWTPQIGGEGDYGWYGPGEGYTAIKLTSGVNFQDIQFLAGSGWGNATTFTQFQLLNDGVVVLMGILEIETGNHSTGAWANGIPNTDGGMAYFGFSGGGFDEIRLQNRGFPVTSFDPAEFEAGAYDSFAAISEVPETAPSIAFFTVAFGILCVRSLRERSGKVTG